MTFIQLLSIVLLISVNSYAYAFWGLTAVQKRSVFSNGFKLLNSKTKSEIVINSPEQILNPTLSSSYISNTPSDLFIKLSDEEEEEEEAPPSTTEAPGEKHEDISSVKEGIMFPTSLNGTGIVDTHINISISICINVYECICVYILKLCIYVCCVYIHVCLYLHILKCIVPMLLHN